MNYEQRSKFLLFVDKLCIPDRPDVKALLYAKKAFLFNFHYSLRFIFN
jgi:hypothetical protein